MEINLIGKNIILRSIGLEDSEFVAELRSNPDNYQFLSSSEKISSENQFFWIKSFLDGKDGFYFIIENKSSKEKVGTIALYNIHKGKAEFGRYIVLDSLSAIESEYLIMKFAFEVLRLDLLYCRTAELNTKVWKQHYLFGFNDAGFEDFKEKNLLLRIQEISFQEFIKFDFIKIKKLINYFNRC